ncbi:Nucleosomal histone H3-Lys79 methylase [Boothiomyces sp. JEL0838]|nr:Nucleosomal histone H3-Lys79 methylase [Boothiomyces sp. JEL0838]
MRSKFKKINREPLFLFFYKISTRMGKLENTKRYVYLPVYLPYLPNTKSTKRKREQSEIKTEPIEDKPKEQKETKQLKKEEKKEVKKDHRYQAPVAQKNAIEAKQIVLDNLKVYKPLEGQDMETITLEYPGRDCREEFLLAISNSPDEYAPITDIYNTVQLIASECLPKGTVNNFGDSRIGIIRNIMKACHKQITADLKDGMLAFNAVMLELKDSGVFDNCEIKGPPASFDLITHILEQSYARSIAPKSHLLNHYEGFSNNVYGEIKHSFVHELIREADIKSTDIFLDMGSGIGNVVLQIAAECLCESYGIEIMEIPSNFAKKQRNEFLSRMRYYSKPCGRIFLKQGDFLEDESISKVISKADVIFVNNYAFDPALNQAILAKFLDLKESAKIITLKSFVPLNSRQQNRRVNAIESIFTVKEYHFARNSVSWMPEGGSYYIHTVDRSLISSVSFN